MRFAARRSPRLVRRRRGGTARPAFAGLAEAPERCSSSRTSPGLSTPTRAKGGSDCGRFSISPIPGDRAKLEPLASRFYDIVLEAGGHDLERAGLRPGAHPVPAQAVRRAGPGLSRDQGRLRPAEPAQPGQGHRRRSASDAPGPEALAAHGRRSSCPRRRRPCLRGRGSAAARWSPRRIAGETHRTRSTAAGDTKPDAGRSSGRE